ncbi:MerR family transcriptional regulator [Sinanaerobacter chloroacetimidivorans]|uniref:MerR family transcriptional regulator n=1 Tax=Sinanaerobacter chloroacetimidivorans TaxID=2818044 RepID=A0A8J7VYK0_9FIRM|nr:MerR family transcriptional regulator [Sinanaerobacter chloroacetimidivorans]MBR0597109.1 MerR family transcriptional regulator [Sinanaerobacter chloroacetimidivorans]
MKIGTFAKKIDMNISTIRFYINNGLLTPCKVGGQYEFDADCISDMEKILKYKKYNFSLEEIQILFFMEKASRFKDEVVIDVCTDILKNKRKLLIEERDNLTKSIADIEREIENLPTLSNEEITDHGVPFTMIPYLYCPSCQVPLKLDSASLSNGSIQKGNLSCECGYTATITEGMILCEEFAEETPFKAFENIESIMAMKDQFSPAYRKLIAKTYIWMYSQIAAQVDGVKFIMAGPFTFNFLLEYIEKLGKDHIYIIFDPSLKRITKIKKYLSSWNYSIVYIVGQPTHLPIKSAAIDLYIDDYSTVNSLFTYNTFSTDYLASLIKNSGEIIGIFTTYLHAAKSIRNFKKNHPDFMPEKMTLGGLKYHWSMEGVTIIHEKVMGSTSPNEIHFPQNVMGEPVEVLGYHARKSVR